MSLDGKLIASLCIVGAFAGLEACGPSKGGAPSADGGADSADGGADSADVRASGDALTDVPTGADTAPERSDAADAGPASPFMAAVQSFCEEKARRVCARDAACTYTATAEAECRITKRDDCLGLMEAGPARSAAAGRLTVDAEAFASCLDASEALPCHLRSNEPIQCMRLFVGTIADGQPCLNRHECAGGICTRTSTCPGTCASYGAIGAECGVANSKSCDPRTLFCDYATHKCALADGARCGGNSDLDSPCGRGAYCESYLDRPCKVMMTGIDNCHCAPRRGAGLACNDSGQCGAGMGCVAGTCRAPGGPGEPCDLNDSVVCRSGLACVGTVTDAGFNLAGTCGARVAEGAKCILECQLGLHCVPDDVDAAASPGTCRPLPGLGQPCQPFSSCAAGLTCGPAGVCIVRPACTVSRDVTCVGKLPVGSNCATSPDCESSFCLLGKCTVACSLSDL